MSIKQEMDQFDQVSDNLNGQANELTEITNGLQKLTLVGSTANSLSSQDIKSSSSNTIIKMEIKQEFPLHGHNLENIHIKLPIQMDNFAPAFNRNKVTGQPDLDYMAVINLYCFWVQTVIHRSRRPQHVASGLDVVRKKLKAYHGTQFGSFYELSKNQRLFLSEYLKRSTEFPYSSDLLQNTMNLNKDPSQPDLDKGVWVTFYHLYLTTLRNENLFTLRNRDLEAIRTENSSSLSQSVQPSQVLTQPGGQIDS